MHVYVSLYSKGNHIPLGGIAEVSVSSPSSACLLIS